MSFNNHYGGAHRSRRAYVMHDRSPEHSDGEKELGDLLSALGYPPVLDKDWKTPRVHIPAAWTEGRHDHDIELEPDWIVVVPWRGFKHGEATAYLTGYIVDSVRWVVNYDGWATHNRTLSQEKRDARHDRWYGRAGYHVLHVGDHHFQNLQAKTDLRSKLLAALQSTYPIVDLAR